MNWCFEAGPELETKGGGNTRPLRVLVVDDSEADYQLSLAALRQGGHAVDSLRVASALDLRHALEERPWDLVLADDRLLRFDNPAALRVVKHYDPDIPFVLVSRRIGAEAAAAVAAAGAHAAVGKDELHRLPALVERELGQVRERVLRRRARLHVAKTEAALRDSEARFLQLAESLPECFWLFDVGERRVVFANRAFTRIWDEPVEALYADPEAWMARIHAEDRPHVVESAARLRFGGLDEELRIERGDGQVRWVHLRTFPIRDDSGVIRSVGAMVSDITNVIDQQLQLQRLAHYDGLTALPNRFLFQERLGNAVALARRNGWQLAVMFIDLDRFKTVNETLGHTLGDELLRQVAVRLRSCLRESDTVGRLGGDEFAVIVPDLERTDIIAAVAEKIVELIAQPFQIQAEEVFISASIGITLFPADAEDIDALIRNADTAMYRAKEAGRNNCQFYTAELNLRARQRHSLEIGLRRALSRRELELHYQPKVSCRSGEILGVEALLRWRHPERGVVSPAEFIPMLEETGLIDEVGEWVLGEACRQAKAWHDAGLGRPSVAVNVSGRQLEAGKLLPAVAAALAASGLPPAALELELTESVLMRDAPATVSILNALKAMGVALSVDDFGTGYSSLAYLKRFPLDTLKVDRSFVQDITVDADDASITRAIINMAHELVLEVVAEGVETEGQLEMLVRAGCDQIQGFLFSRPLLPAELERLLRERWRLPLEGPPLARPGPAGSAPAAAGEAFWRERGEATSALLHAILGPLPAALLGIADDGLIAFANPAAERLLADGAALIGRDAAEVLPPAWLAAGNTGVPLSLRLAGRPCRLHGWGIGADGAGGRVLCIETLETA